MVENLRPLHDRVLVRRRKQEEKTAGGIIIPEVAQEKGQTGEVLAVGTGRVTTDGRDIPMKIKVGDIVIFGKYAGAEVSNDCSILREDEILGVIDSK